MVSVCAVPHVFFSQKKHKTVALGWRPTIFALGGYSWTMRNPQASLARFSFFCGRFVAFTMARHGGRRSPKKAPESRRGEGGRRQSTRPRPGRAGLVDVVRPSDEGSGAALKNAEER